MAPLTYPLLWVESLKGALVYTETRVVAREAKKEKNRRKCEKETEKRRLE